MDLSVVIGTYNRAHQLKGTLEALASQATPLSLAWEIVVVDNNSRDGTPEVVTTFARRSAVPVRYAFEPQQGQNHARNRGIREARGSVIAFTDDDVLPAPDWVAGIPAVMDRWNAWGVGGRILPRWEAAPPTWLVESRQLRGCLALMEFAESRVLVFPMRGQPQVWGANMAFRRELFDEVGEFDSCRGARAGKLYRGDETELINRALERGLRVAYDPTLTVFHRIGRERMWRAYFRKLAFDTGEGEVRSGATASGTKLLRAPRWLYRVAAAELRKWLIAALLRRRGVFERELEFWEAAGQLWGHWTGPK